MDERDKIEEIKSILKQLKDTVGGTQAIVHTSPDGLPIASLLPETSYGSSVDAALSMAASIGEDLGRTFLSTSFSEGSSWVFQYESGRLIIIPVGGKDNTGYLAGFFDERTSLVIVFQELHKVVNKIRAILS